MRCWPAPASAPSIRWCSAASRRIAWRDASLTAIHVVITADEGLRAAQACRSRPTPTKRWPRRRCQGCDRGEAHRRCRAMTQGRDRWYHEEAAKVSADCPRGDGRGRPAVYSLHVGLDGKAQGRAAHFRRLSALCRDDASLCVRLSRRRHLLVHRRCRLGDGPQLYRLWPAGERRHHADVRRRAEPSHRIAVLGSDRQAQGEHLLYRAHRHPRPDARAMGR